MFLKSDLFKSIPLGCEELRPVRNRITKCYNFPFLL